MVTYSSPWFSYNKLHSTKYIFLLTIFNLQLLTDLWAFPPNPQQDRSFYSTQFIILVYIIMSDRDPNKQPEKLELQARQIAMVLDKWP